MTDLSNLPPEIRASLGRATMPDFPEWQRKIRSVGACARPIRLRGGRMVTDAATGELLDAYHTDDDPLGYLMIPCGNRREQVCPSCARVHRDDTYQLMLAGLVGGKGVAGSVAAHPAVFATLTAPSFGAVHTAHRETGSDGLPLRCRIRRDKPICRHGKAMSCGLRHEKAETVVGQALCLRCYDYTGAVLFNSNAGDLWKRFSIYLRRELASTVGLSRKALGNVAKLSFAKVAEYQARGVVHFHAVIRIDGPDGPSSEPPSWASVELIDACVRATVNAVQVEVPDPAAWQSRTLALRFGTQVDVRPITRELVDAEGHAITSRHVASYVAKYVTKSAENTGTLPHRIDIRDLEVLHVRPHTERMIRACFKLDRHPAYLHVPFARWAHMLGYRGHVATKSRAYSTTYAQLRGDRRTHREEERRERLGLAPLDDRLVIVEADWKVIRSGLAWGERPLVDGMRRREYTPSPDSPP